MNLSYKGKILISTPNTSMDIFSRSVIIVIEHNEEGALGLILNKKNDEISSDLARLFDFKVNVYDGGPVSKERLFFIIKMKNDDLQQKNSYFYVTEDAETILSDIQSERISPKDIKIFSGYSGWEAGQLEDEIKNNYWTVIDMPNIHYTTSEDPNMWKKLMMKLGGKYLIWANTPDDISWN